MHRSVVSLSVAAALLAPAAALAQESAVSGNMSLVSDYRFRGITQTFEEPALQGGFDYAHPSGLYAGNWNSSISESFYAGSPLEMDFYGGYKGAAGGLGYDVGVLYYYYPGSDPEIDNTEIYAGVSWKFLSFKYFYAVSDFFGAEDTDGSDYFDLSASYDLGGGWGLAAHLGHQRIEGDSDADYSDYKLGVTKDLKGWIVGAAYVDNDADGEIANPASGTTKEIGDGTLVLSVSRTF